MVTTPCPLPPSAGACILFDIHPRHPPAVLRCLRTGLQGCPPPRDGHGPGDPLGGGAGGSGRLGLASPCLCVYKAHTPHTPCPSPRVTGIIGSLAGAQICLSSHAHHELVESCSSPDAFLDIHSSYSASSREKKITGSASFCVGGGRERTIDNGFVEGTLTSWF